MERALIEPSPKLQRQQIRQEIAWVAIGSIAFALLFFYQILGHITVPIRPDGVFSDWDFNLELRWVASHTIAHFHQFPVWDPYKCGGMPLFANPQSAVLTPFIVLSLLFGSVAGIRLEGIAHVALAFGGAYLLARVVGISKVGAIACAIAFAGSSWPYLHFELGQANFMSLAYLPWSIAALWLGIERRRLFYAAIAGFVLTLTLTEGAPYQFIFTATVLGVLAAIVAIQRRSGFPLLMLAVTALFAAGFGAVKILPVAAYAGWHSTVRDWNEAYGPRDLLTYLFWRVPDEAISPMVLMNTNSGLALVRHPYFELDAYVGILFGGVALLGAILNFKRSLPWIALAVALLALAAGNLGPISPWALTHHVPFLASTRIPARWLMPFTLAIGVLAGFGIDAICNEAKPWGVFAAVLLLAFGLIDNWLVSARDVHLAIEGSDPIVAASPNFRHINDENAGLYRMFPTARANLGLVTCDDQLGFMPKSRVIGYNQPGYRGEQYLLGAGSVHLADWTPNAVSFDVDASAPTIMVINQNFDPGWHIADGHGELGSYGGLIGVRVPAGSQRIVIVYRNNLIWLGLCGTLATLAALLLLWRYEDRVGGKVAA
ncbi:MAG TPA: hypothetical protein VMT58_09020 [Candidatus Binataceae bacterium]|nr:hypothetical protein [Candidatus Binataceae bacterium]